MDRWLAQQSAALTVPQGADVAERGWTLARNPAACQCVWKGWLAELLLGVRNDLLSVPRTVSEADIQRAPPDVVHEAVEARPEVMAVDALASAG